MDKAQQNSLKGEFKYALVIVIFKKQVTLSIHIISVTKKEIAENISFILKVRGMGN